MSAVLSRKALNKLGDAQIQAFLRKARAGIAVQKKLFDGGGLYLTLTPAGTPLWRQKFRHSGVERTLSIGKLADVSLADARKKRDAARDLLRQGRDPVQQGRLARETEVASSSETFEPFAAAWLANQSQWSAIHHKKSNRAFVRDVYPRLGRLPVRDISPALIASVIEAIVKRGARDTAGKVLQHLTWVFCDAQARGIRQDNPAEPARAVLRGGKTEPRQLPALLTFPALGGILRAADAAHLSPAVRMAHRLTAFAAGVRASNVVEAQWCEFDLDADVPMWVIPRSKMKRKQSQHDHKVILCPQIADELCRWRQAVGDSGYVFPSPMGGKHISRESLEKVYRETLGLRDRHCPHGWRSAFSTLAGDNDFDREVVELSLDHLHKNEVVRAYDRGERLQQRIKLMTWWGEQLAQAQRGADVVAMERVSA